MVLLFLCVDIHQRTSVVDKSLSQFDSSLQLRGFPVFSWLHFIENDSYQKRCDELQNNPETFQPVPAATQLCQNLLDRLL
jgi:hypothetical protein